MDERSARRNQETGCQNGLRGLSPSESRMRADTHDGPEQIAPLQRPNTLMQLSRSSILEVHLVRTAGPYIFGTRRQFVATHRFRRSWSIVDMPLSWQRPRSKLGFDEPGRNQPQDGTPKNATPDDVIYSSTLGLGLLADYRRLNRRSRWRHALDGRHHRRRFR
jgi:hypothetical protein